MRITLGGLGCDVTIGTLHQAVIAPAQSSNLTTNFIETLIARGGPEPQEYAALTAWVEAIAEDVKSGRTSAEQVSSMWLALTRQHFRGSLQGLAAEAPHGYHGDFEIIDAIHCARVSTDPALARWDAYFHAQAAPKAVRNRKQYFHDLLRPKVGCNGDKFSVLNVASGPARDVAEWFDGNSTATTWFDCVDLDLNAIRFAESLCAKHADAVRFFHGNALTFKPPHRYDLVWSAGLFDYLEDRLFVRLLRRLIRFTQPGGEVVVGNFGDYNPTRNYMEILGGWRLIHRSREQLIALAMQAGVLRECISIGAEAEGVNLFLHVRV